MIALAAAGVAVGGLGLTALRIYDSQEQTRHDNAMNAAAEHKHPVSHEGEAHPGEEPVYRRGLDSESKLDRP